MHSLFNYVSVVGIFILISGLILFGLTKFIFSRSDCTFTNDCFEFNLFLLLDDFKDLLKLNELFNFM